MRKDGFGGGWVLRMMVGKKGEIQSHCSLVGCVEDVIQKNRHGKKPSRAEAGEKYTQKRTSRICVVDRVHVHQRPAAEGIPLPYVCVDVDSFPPVVGRAESNSSDEELEVCLSFFLVSSSLFQLGECICCDHDSVFLA